MATLAQILAAKSTPQDPLEQAQNQVENDRWRLGVMGLPDPTQKPNPSALERIFGVLDTPGAGVRALIHNATNPMNDKDVSALSEMGKALTGQKRIEGADVLKDWGVDNKWGQFLGGLAFDIFTDPTTYLSGGLKAITKAESASRLARLALEGIDAARLADWGIDAAKYADKIDDAGKLAAAVLSKDDSRRIATAIRKEVGIALGDKGGLKFLGQTIIPDQALREKALYGAKDVLTGQRGPKVLRETMSPLSDWFSKGFLYGEDFAPLAKAGNEVFNEGLKATRKKLSTALSGARKEGADMAKMLQELIPDDTTRSLVTFGIGRQFGTLADQGTLRDATRAVRELQKKMRKSANPDKYVSDLEDAKALLEHELANVEFNPNAIVDTLRAAGITDEALLTKAQEGVDLLQGKLDELIAARGEKGLKNWTLYTGQGSKGYVPGSPPIQQTSKQRASAEEAARLLGFTPGTREQATVMDFMRGTSPSAYKSKDWLNAEERMVEGGLLTETDIAKLGGVKVAKDYADIAFKDFQDDIAKMTGGEIPAEAENFVKGVRKAFTDDEAFKGLLGAYDKSLNWFRRMATIYNVPQFPARNFLSNKFLQWTEGLLDPESERVASTIMAKRGKNLTKAEQELYDRAVKAGALTTADALSEQIGAQQLLQGGLTRKLSNVNAMVENQSRLSAFIAATKKGISDEAAASVVDTALYNYAPEALTSFERNVMKRVVPFYTWSRRNTPHMFSLLFKNPGKLTPVGHAKESGEVASGVSSEDMPSYLQNMFAIPLPNGNLISTGGVLPLQDLERLIPQAPREYAREQMTQLSPLIRDPLELLFNKDLYRDTDIQSFKGEMRAAPSYVALFDQAVVSTPAAGAWEAIKKQLGMGYKTRSDGEQYLAMNPFASKLLKDMLPFMSGVARGFSPDDAQKFSQLSGVKLVPTDTAEWQRQKVYEDRKTLQDYLNAYKEQNPKAEIPTVKKKNTLKDLLGGK